jgi:hypothetical protein
VPKFASTASGKAQQILTAMKNFVPQLGIQCVPPAAIQEMDRYCQAHPGGPAAVRRPQLFIRGANFVVLLGRNVGEGIAGFGATVPPALRAFDQQYLKALRPAPEREFTS